jgi:flagellar hook-associated protein 2
MRITGFADGFDSEAMVSALMEVARSQQDRYNELAYEQELKLAAWNRVESSLGTLQDKAYDLTSMSTWEQMDTTASNSSVLSLSATTLAAEGNYDITVSKMAQAHRIGSDAQADTTSPLGLAGQFTIGGEPITIDTDASLENIRDAINLAAHSMADDEAVEATIVDTTLVLTRKQTGATQISLSDDSGDVLESLGILDASKAVKNELSVARDLQAQIMGIDITRSSNTNLDDIITGVTLDITGEGTSTFSVSHDRDSVKSLIQDFISTYNSTMEALESQGNATVGGDSDVVAATLQGDSLLRSIESKSRSLITGSDDTGTLADGLESLRKIGIWTSGKENRLSITDSAAFNDALENNFDDVEDLFRDYNAGIMRKFETYMKSLTSSVDGAVNRRQQGIQDRVDAYDEKIADMERSLTAYQDQLWEQFTTMETTIAGFQQQSNYLSSIFDAQTSSKD